MRVVLPRTAEIDPPELVQSELSRIELRMLPGQDDRRRDALRRKRMGDGLQFDGFRSGADDQPYIPGTQPSP
jgi:hypothetical protein